jgi:hypothetical protein
MATQLSPNPLSFRDFFAKIFSAHNNTLLSWAGAQIPELNEENRGSAAVLDPDLSIPDPDPAFRLNTNPDPVQDPGQDPGFWWPKLEINYSWIFFLNQKLLWTSKYRRSLQPSKENIQHFKLNFFSIYVGHFWSSGSGSFNLFPDPVRIRIRNTGRWKMFITRVNGASCTSAPAQLLLKSLFSGKTVYEWLRTLAKFSSC